MELLTEKNYKWIYTYDYAPGSVWEPWKESADVPGWITGEAEAVAVRAKQNEKMAGKKLPAFFGFAAVILKKGLQFPFSCSIVPTGVHENNWW